MQITLQGKLIPGSSDPAVLPATRCSAHKKQPLCLHWYPEEGAAALIVDDGVLTNNPGTVTWKHFLSCHEHCSALDSTHPQPNSETGQPEAGPRLDTWHAHPSVGGGRGTL